MMTDIKTLTIAILPFDGYGGLYPCIGLAQVLSKLGQKCVFVVKQSLVQQLTKEGFECRVFDDDLNNDNKLSFWSDFIAKNGHTLKLSAFDKIKALDGYTLSVNEMKRIHEKLLQTLNDLRPDVMILDNFVSVPAAHLTGIPWIRLCSAHPLQYWFDDTRLPPSSSGLSVNGDQRLWTEFREEFLTAYGQLWDDFNDWYKSITGLSLKPRGQFTNPSPYFNLYICPKELDYSEISPKDPKKWFAVDNLCREETKSEAKLQIPEEFRNRPGKLVYLSMGSLACCEVTLMKRLIAILSKSKQRFIVSKGPFGDQLSLPDNMWGQNSLPQIQVLSLVDAVITHGGNNTVTESFEFGKPMIILPMFGDQYDNAQRIQDTGLGVRLDPYLCSESDLLSAVDRVVNDLELKYEKISQRIRSNKTKEKAAQLVIDLIINKRYN